MKDFKDVSEAVKAYVTVRDRFRVWQKKRDEEETLKKKELEEIEMWLLQRANEQGVDSFKTSFGTAYKQLKEHFRIGDWDKFVKYVKKTGNFQLFEKRVAKLAAKEIYEVKKKLPDGLDYSSEYVIHVLKPSNKSKGKEE